MAKYVVSGEAQADLDSITRYTVSRYGEMQGRRYLSQIHGSAQVVAEFPQAGRIYVSGSGTTYRRYNCGRHALLYIEREDDILIVRVLHLAMDFDRHLD